MLPEEGHFKQWWRGGSSEANKRVRASLSFRTLGVRPGAPIFREETEPSTGYATSDRGFKSRALREQVPVPELCCSPAAALGCAWLWEVPNV